MDLHEYHRALNLGFSERDAVRMGEDRAEEIMIEESRKRRQPDQQYEIPCDICGAPARAGSDGLNVCSRECADEAVRRSEPSTDTPT
jgi:hypothetical protein